MTTKVLRVNKTRFNKNYYYYYYFVLDLHSDAAKLVKYIMTTFLRITPPSDETDIPPTKSDALSEESGTSVQGITSLCV